MSRVDETLGARWSRRALTIPGYFAATALVLGALPVIVPLAAVVDLLRGKRFVAVRCALAVPFYLLCECAGLLASLGLWLASPLLGGTRGRRCLALHRVVQNLWARSLFAALRVLFQLRFEVSGNGDLPPGPLIVFMRHTSIADTLLPSVFLSHDRGLRLRYVLKRELLWDPCLDVVGQRLPNVFVRRGSSESERETASVRQLAAGLATGEGVLIYPEGTRFTPAKRDRILATMASRKNPRAQRAGELRHVLPPRLGGPLALVDARPDADIVFCAHAGFDAAATIQAVWNGGLVGRTVYVDFRTVHAGDVPDGADARVRWLDDEWARVDEWIDFRGAPHT